MLLLEPLEARYCFSAATAESVVLIDKALPNDSLLTRAIVPGGKTILYDGAHETAAEVLARTTRWAEVSGIKITSISLLSHASAGRFALGNEWISNRTLDATAQAWEALGKVLSDGASWLPSFDFRWVIAGGAVFVGLMLLGASFGSKRRR